MKGRERSISQLLARWHKNPGWKIEENNSQLPSETLEDIFDPFMTTPEFAAKAMKRHRNNDRTGKIIRDWEARKDDRY